MPRYKTAGCKHKQKPPHNILMTGNVLGELILEAKQSGALDVIEKPADLKTLTEKIKKAAAQKAKRKQTCSPKK